MSMGPIDPQRRARAWITAGAVALALLIVPFGVWLVLPSPPKIPVPHVMAAPNEPPSPRPAAPTPAPRPRGEPPPEDTPPPADEAQVVRGRVLGPNGGPVGRAWVTCTDRDFQTVSDDEGNFELPSEALSCLAIARKSGFGSSEKVALRRGEARVNTLELRGGGKIEGVVVDEAGAPVPKFTLSVEKFVGDEGDDEGPNGRARPFEDDQGRFVLANATPGKYVLAASTPGRPPARTDTIEVSAGRSVTGVRIVLARGAVLRGVITDEATRKPIADATVALDAVSFSGPSSVPPVSTDETGAYVMEGVPPSSLFSIRVEKAGYRTRIVSGLSARGGEATSSVGLTPKGDKDTTDTDLGGIGATLAPAPNAFGAMVVSVLAGSPASTAGLQRGDRIVRVDGVATDAMTVSDVIQRLRGEPGTRVSVSIDRDGQEVRKDLVRAVVTR